MLRTWLDRGVAAFVMGWGFRVFEVSINLMRGGMTLPAGIGFALGFGFVIGGLGLSIRHPWSKPLILIAGWGGCVAELIGLFFIHQFFARQGIPMPFPHQAAVRMVCFGVPALWIHLRQIKRTPSEAPSPA